ncbi:MAG: type II secretion system F family protein [Acidimicrobiales bacterium]
MSRLIVVVLAAIGTHYLTTAVLLGWQGVGLRSRAPARARTSTGARWLQQAGLVDVTAAQFVAAMAAAAVVSASVGYALFGGAAPTIVAAACGAAIPLLIHRQRRSARRRAAHRAWPSMIEEIRILTGPVGLSIPQALLEVGAGSPEQLRWAFEAGGREWSLSTDFDRTIRVLKDELADPTADVTLETLLVAHEVGGIGLGRRLADLAEDRAGEIAANQDATARLAGARFARLFVLIVPMGMTMAGLSLGTGRQAYSTTAGQALVVAALVMIGICWLWASHFLRIPEPRRVFER